MKKAKLLQCCNEAQSLSAAGWTWFPPSGTPDTTLPQLNKVHMVKYFNNTIYNCERSEDRHYFVQRDVYILNGRVDAAGGDLSLHTVNGTFADSTIHFAAEETGGGGQKYHNISVTLKSGWQPPERFTGRAYLMAGKIYLQHEYTAYVVGYWVSTLLIILLSVLNSVEILDNQIKCETIFSSPFSLHVLQRAGPNPPSPLSLGKPLPSGLYLILWH